MNYPMDDLFRKEDAFYETKTPFTIFERVPCTAVYLEHRPYPCDADYAKLRGRQHRGHRNGNTDRDGDTDCNPDIDCNSNRNSNSNN